MLRNDGGNALGKSAAATLYKYAAPVPMPMSVNMFRCRETIDAAARTKNGQPHQRTTGVAKASSIHGSHGFIASLCMPNISDMPRKSSGIEKIRLMTKRRRMSSSSAFGASSSDAVIGSSAIPQIGQTPGLSLTTSGCMGQVNRDEGRGAREGSGFAR